MHSKEIQMSKHIPQQEVLISENFHGAPLLPGNTVDVDTIQSQRFYCEKYQAEGRWICQDGKIATVFYHKGKQYCLPFRAIFKPNMLHCLREAAILQMEDAIEEDMLPESGFEEW